MTYCLQKENSISEQSELCSRHKRTSLDYDARLRILTGLWERVALLAF